MKKKGDLSLSKNTTIHDDSSLPKSLIINPYLENDTTTKIIGSQIKMQRILRGLTQEQLANSLGITFQQLQKYERGVNRISACRLYDISKVLKKDISFFFDACQSNPLRNVLKDSKGEMDDRDLMGRKETIELIRSYYSIKNENIRQKILELAKMLSQDENINNNQ